MPMQGLGDSYMAYSKQEVIELLRSWGYSQLADEASRELPDPVDLDQLQDWNMQHGLSHDDLISHLGGSP